MFKALSPMYMGPVDYYHEQNGRPVSGINAEVAWQYS